MKRVSARTLLDSIDGLYRSADQAPGFGDLNVRIKAIKKSIDGLQAELESLPPITGDSRLVATLEQSEIFNYHVSGTSTANAVWVIAEYRACLETLAEAGSALDTLKVKARAKARINHSVHNVSNRLVILSEVGLVQEIFFDERPKRRWNITQLGQKVVKELGSS